MIILGCLGLGQFRSIHGVAGYDLGLKRSEHSFFFKKNGTSGWNFDLLILLLGSISDAHNLDLLIKNCDNFYGSVFQN